MWAAAQSGGVDRRLVAYHEAGHAVARYLVGWEIGTVSIVPTAIAEGYGAGDVVVEIPASDPDPGAYWRRTDEAGVFVLLAGLVAEDLVRGAPPHPINTWCTRDAEGWTAPLDLLRAIAIAETWLSSQATVEDHLVRVQRAARETLRRPEHWRAVAALADELLAHGVVEGSRAREIIARATARGGVV